MNKVLLIDYLSYTLFKTLAFLVRLSPLEASLFFGRRLGDMLYCFDLKHKAIAYSNIKTAFGEKLSQNQLSKLTLQFYRAFGQNLIEIFFIPFVDKRYIKKYVTIEGMDNLLAASKKQKGIIFLGVHAGSWELSNIIAANMGVPFSLFVRSQPKYRLIENLLNKYRTQKGCKIIYRNNQTRSLIECLRKNETVAMTADQGGKGGILVKFFGRNASMPTGAVRIALKYGIPIIPVYFTRVTGPHIKIILGEPFQAKNTGNLGEDLRNNLQDLVLIFEKYISMYPKEYLWSYKIWKYANERNILVLSDGKAGHLRQSEALAKLAVNHLKDKGITSIVKTVEVKFRSELSRKALSISSCLSGRYRCQGCLVCLKNFLALNSFQELVKIKPDLVVSCGSKLAPVNFLLSRENAARSAVILRPSLLSIKRFDLVVLPKHDNPPKRKNVVTTLGALNLIDKDYLAGHSEKLIHSAALDNAKDGQYVGVLVGGDTKNYRLSLELMCEAIKQIKASSEMIGARVLITTSRRTPKEVEGLLKKEFCAYAKCGLLIIANEKNMPEAVGGILGLSKVVVTSCESISMVSEAVNSGKPVIVLKDKRLGKKHSRFLVRLFRGQYIHLIQNPLYLGRKIEELWNAKGPSQTLEDNRVVKEALGRIL